MWGTYLIMGWCQLLLNRVDQAIDLLIKSRAANPRPWVTHFGLAAALGLKGDLDGATAALSEFAEAQSSGQLACPIPCLPALGNLQYWELFEKTAAAGLRRVGFPDE